MKNRRDVAIKIASTSKLLNVIARSFHNMSRRMSSRYALSRKDDIESNLPRETKRREPEEKPGEKRDKMKNREM